MLEIGSKWRIREGFRNKYLSTHKVVYCEVATAIIDQLVAQRSQKCKEKNLEKCDVEREATSYWIFESETKL